MAPRVVVVADPDQVIFGRFSMLFVASPNGPRRLSAPDPALEAVRFLEVDFHPCLVLVAPSPVPSKAVASPVPSKAEHSPVPSREEPVSGQRPDGATANPSSPPLVVDLTNVTTTRCASPTSLRDLVPDFCSSLHRSPYRGALQREWVEPSHGWQERNHEASRNCTTR